MTTNIENNIGIGPYVSASSRTHLPQPMADSLERDTMLFIMINLSFFPSQHFIKKQSL